MIWENFVFFGGGGGGKWIGWWWGEGGGKESVAVGRGMAAGVGGAEGMDAVSLAVGWW